MPEFLQNYQAEGDPFHVGQGKNSEGMTADHLKIVLENHRDSFLCPVVG